MALVPFSYNWRSLRARPSATAMTILSIAATVAVLAFMLALQQGFTTMFAERGRADLAIFLRPAANSEGESAFTREVVDDLIKSTPEIAVDEDGQPLASGELFLAIRRFKVDGGETNVAFRGVQPATFAVHRDDFQVMQGRRITAGSDELMVGASLVGRIRDSQVGDVLMVNTTPFRIVGTFTHKGAHSSEIWGDADRLQEALERPVFSRVIGVLRPEASAAAVNERLSTNKLIPARATSERDYLVSQTRALSTTLQVIGVFLAILMGVAAVFTGTNSMLAAVAARTHEIGILLSLGFRPYALFASFLIESALIGVLGGVVGCLVVMPLQGIQTGTMNMQTFTEIAFGFNFTPSVLATAVAFAMALGLLGGAVPAWRAARMTPTSALRRG